MPIPATQFIWFNGKLVPWEKATVHVLSHALHYGSSVFEGVRAYETPRGVAIFRLRDHTRRLFDSAKIYRINIPFSAEAVNEACRQVIAANALKRGAYIRPVVFRGYGEIGVTPKIEPPTEVAVAAWEWDKYLGHEAEEAGGDACVSSWQRVARERGLEVRECAIPRELLYLADEAFFTGTAVEITAIRSVDRLAIGSGRRGPVTESLQNAFFGLFSGKTADKWGWLDYVDMSAPRVAASG